jgi:hypothetical protein
LLEIENYSCDIMEEETLKFVPLKSVIDAGFWESLTKKKLDEWKLDDSEKPITWSYTPGKSFIRLGKQFTVFLIKRDSVDVRKSSKISKK